MYISIGVQAKGRILLEMSKSENCSLGQAGQSFVTIAFRNEHTIANLKFRTFLKNIKTWMM